MPSTEAHAGPASPSLRILVADDDPVNRRLYSLMLGKSGHEAHVVSDGLEALDALSGNAYDLVLLDMSMPRLDGPETARRIRQGHAGEPGACMPILAITGFTEDEEHKSCLEAGMDGVIVKPFTLEALIPWLDRCQAKD